MSLRRARRRSFLERLHPLRVRRGDLRAWLAEPETHLPEQALTLPHAELHVVPAAQVLGQQLAVPQVPAQPEVVRPVA